MTSSIVQDEYLLGTDPVFSMQGVQAPTGATQAKERLYTQLAGSFGRMNRALVQTSNLCELLQMDLHAMRTFVGLDAAT